MTLSIALIIVLFVVFALVEALRVLEGDLPRWIRMLVAFGLVILPPILDLILASQSIELPKSLDVYVPAVLFLAVMLLFTARDFLRARERGEAALRQTMKYMLSRKDGGTTREEIVEHLVEMRQEDEGRVERLASWCLARLAEEGFVVPASGE